MVTLIRSWFAPPRDLILLVIAAWLGATLPEKRSARHGLSPQAVNDLIFVGLLAYILGGRLFFAVEHLSAFIQSPLGLISLNIASFDNVGALAAALIAGLAYGWRKQLTLWRTLDALTLFFAALAVGLGFQHLASGAAFGQETNLPWAIELWGTTRHPTQVYEILASLLTLGLLWYRKADSKPGSNFLTFAALTSASRLVIESFRGDSTLVFGGLRLAQIAAWLVLAASLVGLEIPKPEPISPVAIAQKRSSNDAENRRLATHKSRPPSRTKRRTSSQRKATSPRRKPRKK